MQRFFLDGERIDDGKFTVSGEKFNHICNSLRMSVGDTAVFCDGEFTDYRCKLLSVQAGSAVFSVLSSARNETEPKIKITVFQCLPKGDKMDDMVKRCVQFGVYRIVPVISSRCISRPDKKTLSKKTERLNKISRSSAMQSMRGCIPRVENAVDFSTAIERLCEYPTRFICYEQERTRKITRDMLHGDIAFLIGPEGGISPEEMELAARRGIDGVSLGGRILRTEDAASFLLPILLSMTDNL